MTAVLTPHSTVPASPAARRRPAPSIKDGRLVAGVLLVLVSVVAGARAVSAAARTTPVVAVRADLPAGHVLVAADLTVREVHLDGGTGTYVSEPGRLVGRPLTRAVAAGELLPPAAVADGQAQDTAVVPVTVAAGRAPDLSGGDLADVWATFPSGGDDKTCVTVVVARGLEVVGTLDTDGPDRAVSLQVPAAQVGAVVHAAATTTLVLTRHEASTRDAPDPTTQVDGLTPTGRCGSTAS